MKYLPVVNISAYCMNIAQIGLTLYQLIYPPRKQHICVEPKLIVNKIVRPNMVLLSDNRRIRLHDIITPNTDSRSTDERQAAIYVMRQMSYKYVDKQVTIHNETNHLLGTTNADIVCANKTMKQWLMENNYAVREQRHVPTSWMEYMAQKHIKTPPVNIEC